VSALSFWHFLSKFKTFTLYFFKNITLQSLEREERPSGIWKRRREIRKKDQQAKGERRREIQGSRFGATLSSTTVLLFILRPFCFVFSKQSSLSYIRRRH